MASLIINGLLIGWVVLFAAMALLPLLMDRTRSTGRRAASAEDRVLRIEHRAVIERHGVRQPMLVPVDSIGDHPSHRPAA